MTIDRASVEEGYVSIPLASLRELLFGPPKPEITDLTLDENGEPKRWSDPTYLGDGPWGA